MKVHVYAIYDSKVCAYMMPFCSANHEAAKREFGDVARNRESQIGRHPEDYSLFCIGKFDDNSGGIEPLTALCVWTGLEAVKPGLRERDDFDIQQQVSLGLNGGSARA